VTAGADEAHRRRRRAGVGAADRPRGGRADVAGQGAAMRPARVSRGHVDDGGLLHHEGRAVRRVGQAARVLRIDPAARTDANDIDAQDGPGCGRAHDMVDQPGKILGDARALSRAFLPLFGFCGHPAGGGRLPEAAERGKFLLPRR
jgi:hypothetical protein